MERTGARSRWRGKEGVGEMLESSLFAEVYSFKK